MTTDHDHIDDDIDARDTDAKLARQQRRQLSALVDGELAPDQARFLLRRLAHDDALAGRWQRWQVIGDVLRGQAVAALPAGADGFAARVAASVARERAPATATATGRRWRQGLGMAAAASVAAVALFVARPLPVDGERTNETIAIQAPPATPPAAPAAVPVAVPVESVREVSVPQFAATAPEPVAASVREPAASPAPRRRSPEPVRPSTVAVAAQPDSVPGPNAAIDPPALVLAGNADSDARPFASPAEPQARPWPQAVLTGLGEPAGGPFTVGFGDTVEAPSFYPFEPQLPERAADDPERTQ